LIGCKRGSLRAEIPTIPLCPKSIPGSSASDGFLQSYSIARRVSAHSQARLTRRQDETAIINESSPFLQALQARWPLLEQAGVGKVSLFDQPFATQSGSATPMYSNDLLKGIRCRLSLFLQYHRHPRRSPTSACSGVISGKDRHGRLLTYFKDDQTDTRIGPTDFTILDMSKTLHPKQGQEMSHQPSHCRTDQQKSSWCKQIPAPCSATIHRGLRRTRSSGAEFL